MPYEVALTYRDEEFPTRVTLVGVITDPEAVEAVAQYFEKSRGPLPFPPDENES
jgi:hypothetical protein